MKAVSLLLAAALAMLAALAAFAPAAWLDTRLQYATEGQLRLADTAGTVWNGRGIVTNQQRTLAIQVRWQVDLRPLLQGNVVVALHGVDGSELPRGDVAWRNGGLGIDGLSLTLPAMALNAGGNALALGGNVAIDVPHLRWNEGSVDGAAALQWTGARVADGEATVALGTVSMDVAPRDGRLEGRIENRGGEIRVEGDFAWTQAAVTVNVTLTPLPSTPPAVARALSALGTPDASGAVRLQWRGGAR